MTDQEPNPWWILCLVTMLKGDIDFNKLPKTPELSEKDKTLIEEYAKAGACERAIKDTRNTLIHGGHPMIKKEVDEVRCHGYIYCMNECVCDRCEACKIQYGHPFDPYWNNKKDFVQYDEFAKNVQQMLPSINYNHIQEKKCVIYQKEIDTCKQ